MSAVAIIAITAVCVMVTGGFLGCIFWLLMIEEFDRRKPENNVYSGSGLTRWGSLNTFSEYRNSVPDGKLHVYAQAAFALAMVGMASLIAAGAYSITVNQPAVRITHPIEGAIFTAPTNIVISADASEGSISISRVDFY